MNEILRIIADLLSKPPLSETVPLNPIPSLLSKNPFWGEM